MKLIVLEETRHGIHAIEEKELLKMKATIEADLSDSMGYRKFRDKLKMFKILYDRDDWK